MKRLTSARIWFAICTFVSVSLIVAGFCVPPAGVIDGSVLTAVGELFGFAALAQLPEIIHGRSVELHHGKTHITLGDDDGADSEGGRDRGERPVNGGGKER